MKTVLIRVFTSLSFCLNSYSRSCTYPKIGLHVVCVIAFGLLTNHSQAKPYTLNQAVAQAQRQDPWIIGSQKRQESLEAKSLEVGSFPDPTVSLSLANLPIDTFDFSQEGMTQLKVGISQTFPRGKTLSLKQARSEKLSQIQPYARQNRKAQVAVNVTHLWLEAYRNGKTILLINNDRSLFEHLVDAAQSNYSSASGHTQQQDIVRAQLELTRIDDRLTRLQQQHEMYLAKLGEWLNDSSVSLAFPKNDKGTIEFLTPQIITGENDSEKLNTLTKTLNQHPLIRSIDWKIQAFESDIELAEQSYKPQWGLNASYGYRDQTPVDEDRSDLFSVGVKIDLPLFTGNRQDKKVQSAQAEFEAVKTERTLALRRLKSEYASAEAIYLRLKERKSLFDSRLLKEMAEQAESSLTAYTNDDGDFAEVVRARIAELNARIEALNVDIDMQKSIAQLNYFQSGINELPPSEKTSSRQQ